MKHLLVVASGLFVVSAAEARDLRPMEAALISAGDVRGTAYFTQDPDGFPVVTTLVAGEQGTPVRFISTLQAGQKMVISVPRLVGQSAVEVEIARIGDTVHVTQDSELAVLN